MIKIEVATTKGYWVIHIYVATTIIAIVERVLASLEDLIPDTVSILQPY